MLSLLRVLDSMIDEYARARPEQRPKQPQIDLHDDDGSMLHLLLRSSSGDLGKTVQQGSERVRGSTEHLRLTSIGLLQFHAFIAALSRA